MEKLNETPVRTSRNFLINNIKLESLNLPNVIDDFKNVEILGESSKITIDSNVSDFNLTYGLGDLLTRQVKEQANKSVRIVVDNKTNKDVYMNFYLDEDNSALIDNIQIVANEGTKATIVLKYDSNESVKAFHNGIINVLAKDGADISVIVVNFINRYSNNFMSIENLLNSDSKVKFTIVDFGGNNSVINYYSNLLGNGSDNRLNTIYIGKENQLFDLNYIGELRGEKSNIDIEVQGALKDTAKKHFKGTIDFKKGCKKAKGNENEYCMLLSDTAKSLGLPMLLCSEEEIEGNHSSAVGKIGEKELFYIMSRGFTLKQALKLMVRAKFNNILSSIKIDELKEQVLDEIDKRLD